MGALIDLNGLGHYKSKENAMVASVYSATKTYAVGDYAYYNGTLYRCTTAITTAEAWTAGHWTAAKIGDDVTELKTAIIQNKVEDVPLIEEKLEFVKSQNLFDTDKAEIGYIDTSGNFHLDQVFKVSDFIPVMSGETIKSYYKPDSAGVYPVNMRYICAYDSSKNAVAASGSSTSVNAYTVPDNISYIRVSAYANTIINFMIIEGTTAPTNYIPYYAYYEASGDFIEDALNELGIIDADAIDAKILVETNRSNNYVSQSIENAISAIELPSEVAVVSYTLEQFTGDTLEDKLFNALDTITYGIITCGNVSISKKYNAIPNKNYTYITIADSVLNIGVDGWFDGSGNNYIYSPAFTNCYIRFTAGNALYAGTTGDIVVNPIFEKCIFSNAIILNSNTVIMQSLVIDNCTFYFDSPYTSAMQVCKASEYFDLSLTRSTFNAGNGKIIVSNDSGTYTYAIQTATIQNNVFQGRKDIIFDVGSCSIITIIDNYFELNDDLYIDIDHDIDVFTFDRNSIIENNSTIVNHRIEISATITDEEIARNHTVMASGMSLVGRI